MMLDKRRRRLMTNICLSLSVTVASLWIGCGGTDDCTDVFVQSTIVEVFNSSGDRINDVTVEYSVASPDGDGQWMECQEFGHPDGPKFSCGFEQEGQVTVRATNASGDSVEETVTVEADECHVITEHVTLMLDPA